MKFYPKTKELKYDVNEILFIDTERKTLPFKQAASCKIMLADTWEKFEALMKAGCGLMEDKLTGEKAEYYGSIKVVIIDSFTRVLFLLSEYLKEKQIKGYDFWASYFDMLERLLMTWESKGRFIVFTGLDEVVRDSDSVDRIVVKVEGKKLEGKIESFFTIVLHTRFNPAKPHPEGYQFCTNTDGKNTAKSPEGMFNERYIQNNMAFVIGSIYEYYDMANHPEFMPSPILIVGKSGTGKSTSMKYLFDIAEEVKK